MTVRIKGVTVELNGTNYVIPPIALWRAGAVARTHRRILTATSKTQNKSPPLLIAPMPPCAAIIPILTREQVADFD